MTYAPKIQGDFALNQIVVHLALVTRSIAGPGNQATIVSTSTWEPISEIGLEQDNTSPGRRILPQTICRPDQYKIWHGKYPFGSKSLKFVLPIEVVQKSSDIEIIKWRLNVHNTKEKANREAINSQIEEQGETNAHEKHYLQRLKSNKCRWKL